MSGTTRVVVGLFVLAVVVSIGTPASAQTTRPSPWDFAGWAGQLRSQISTKRIEEADEVFA
jgi:hypothetical protein